MNKNRRSLFDSFSAPKLLANLALAEASRQGYLGKLAVMCSVRNRVLAERRRYGKGYHGVMLKKYQYSCFTAPENHYSYKVLTGEPDNATLKMATGIISGEIADITDGATHYCNPQAMSKRMLRRWLAWCGEKKMIGCGRFGDHVFFREEI